MTIYKIWKHNNKVETVDIREVINKTEEKGFYTRGSVRKILETIGQVETPWAIYTTQKPTGTFRQYLVIGNGEVKDALTLEKRIITNHLHSVYDTEEDALRIAHWINQLQTGLKYHVEEKVYAFPA